MDGLTPVGQVDGLLAPRNSMTYKSLGPNDRPRSSRQNLGSNDRPRSSRHKKSSTDLGKEDVSYSQPEGKMLKSSRVSPSDTVIHLNERQTRKNKFDQKNYRNRRSNSSGFLSVRAEKKKKTVISRNFHIRECFRYVENQAKLECGCGRKKNEHPDDHVVDKTQQMMWSPEKCTRRLPTDTYGEIEFADDPGTSKPYIRIDHETNSSLLLQLMRKCWNMEVPNLVISVTGGAKDFKLKPRLEDEFSKGLIKVAISTGAWIITGGTNAGVMKHVGEAVKSRGSAGRSAQTKINVIGIASWGVLDSSDQLISKTGEGCHPAQYSPNTSKTCLDHNHSHFLLVDNGTKGKYGTEIELRSRVEETIGKDLKTESNTSKGAIGIPVVILCLEGGPNTIKTMAEAIKKGTPAVVIDGSGRAADVVSFAYKHLEFDDERMTSYINPQYVEEVQIKVRDVFGEKDMLKIYNEIEELLKEETMVSIYRLDDEGENDMDLAILKALLKANKGSREMQLKLALAWNRIDVAKSEIFTEGSRTNKIDWLYESMFTALLDDKHDFVELFLDEGLHLKHFLTLDILESLYNGIPNGAAVRQLINRNLYLSKDASPEIDMEVIGSVVEDLMGDRFVSRYRVEDCYKPRIERETRCSVVALFDPNAGKVDTSLNKPHLDLFIWAVLCNRHELSLLLWERTRDSIACALMASKLLKTLADRIGDNRELSYMSEDLVKNGEYYEQVAVGVLVECSTESEYHAQMLLVKELKDFGFLTSLDIAVEANNQDFIAHSSCQTLLTKLWMGALYINTELWKVLVCIFVPPLVSVLIKLREDVDGDGDFDDPVSTDSTGMLKFDLDKDFMQNSQNNSATPSLEGSEYSLQKELIVREETHNRDGSKTMEQDTHTVMDHLDDHDESADIALRNPKCKPGHFHRLIHFHEAPYVKFTVNVLFYVALLLLYTFILLTRLTLSIHWTEYALQFWVFTLLCEEIRQLIVQDPKEFLGKWEFYIKDPWNINDLFSLVGFIIATILRYMAHAKGPGDDGEQLLIAARIIYSADIVAFIVRLLQIFSVNRNLGPKLVMIKKMLNDLVYFVVILAVFIISYGVASQAVQYPNQSLSEAAKGVLNVPYWQMYGELFIDEILEDKINATTGLRLCDQDGWDGDPCSTEYGKAVAPVYMAVYMLFTNILLLNLLIAIFNNTFEKVQEDSDKVWKFQRYDLIYEYHDRPSLCPPFIIFSHIFSLFRWFAERCRCCGCVPEKGSSIKTHLTDTEEEALSVWEYMRAEAYVYRSSVLEAETQDSRLKTIMSRLNTVSEDITQIKLEEGTGGGRKEVVASNNRPETRHGGLGGRHRSIVGNGVETRLAKLEYNIEHVLEMLIQQNQNQAAILEASERILNMAGPASSSAHASSTNTSKAYNDIRSKITNIHTKARLSPYPGSTIQRFKIPDSHVMWEVPFEDYTPVKFTSPHVLSGPYWADVDLLEMNPRPQLLFNEYDEVNKVNRRSHIGTYEVIDNLSRNPYGRTGVYGRGQLGRFGPNHAADPIATRWKRSSSGIVMDKGKRVLEFIAIQRKDNHQWAIPGGMVEPGENVSETLRKEFTEEALAKLDMSEEKRKQISERVSYLFQNGTEVYKGYVDDPRNTDNSWMETVACNFHDDSGEIFGEFQLQAGDDARAVRWQRVSGNIPLFASHVGILENVAKIHGAAFY